MLLPMFGFVMTLIVVGGLASLVAAGDPASQHRLAPFIGLVALFAGLGALLMSLGLAWLVGVIIRSESLYFTASLLVMWRAVLVAQRSVLIMPSGGGVRLNLGRKSKGFRNELLWL